MTTISFTGGLGAQIMSACGYFYLQEMGEDVGAEKLATLEKLNQAQIWTTSRV